jgi:hypothetical protein
MPRCVTDPVVDNFQEIPQSAADRRNAVSRELSMTEFEPVQFDSDLIRFLNGTYALCPEIEISCRSQHIQSEGGINHDD